MDQRLEKPVYTWQQTEMVRSSQLEPFQSLFLTPVWLICSATQGYRNKMWTHPAGVTGVAKIMCNLFYFQ